MIYRNVTQLIGGTPLVRLEKIMQRHECRGAVIAKVEMLNPGGSVKDRVARAMIADAEQCGRLLPHGTIIEPTSGNTGIGLAMCGTVMGYRVILTMPSSMSIERRRLAEAYGAEIVLTPAEEGMKGAIAEAERLRDSIEGAVILEQFSNEACVEAHMMTTGEEIWNDTDGHVDLFVAGVGTGATISGVGRALKAHHATVRVVAVEPASSPVLSGGTAAPHRIQGIGAGFIPKNFDSSIVDAIEIVTDEEALSMAAELARIEGLFCGISSGAALCAALRWAKRPEMEGKNIVVLLPDTGERYLSCL